MSVKCAVIDRIKNCRYESQSSYFKSLLSVLKLILNFRVRAFYGQSQFINFSNKIPKKLGIKWKNVLKKMQNLLPKFFINLLVNFYSSVLLFKFIEIYC